MSTLPPKKRCNNYRAHFIGPADILRSSGASTASVASGSVGIGGAAGSVRSEGQCTRLATFMLKGGVYKTMTTILSVSALAAPPYNKKVLIVDADSQCNTTSFFCPEPPDWQKEVEAMEGLQGGNSDDEPAGDSVSLSEKEHPSFCPETDPFPPTYFEYDTWLENVDGGKVPTIHELLYSDFNQGVGSATNPDLKLMPVSHFQKKDFPKKLSAKKHVVCQNCSKTKARTEFTSDDKPFRDNDWLCSPECREKRAKENNLFLLPGSTKLIFLESKLSLLEDPRMFTSIDRLFTKLANLFELDFIFVDLGPNHGKLNMAFALSCHAMLPPVHADFYSATSMSRMLEDKGVLCQWNDWRKKFVKNCEAGNSKYDAGPYRKMPKLLPFLVSGYETEKSHKQPYPRLKKSKDKGGYEYGKVKEGHAFFVASMSLLVEDDTIPATIRNMFQPDGDAMVIPFCRAINQGTSVSHALGIPQHQIFKKDIDDFYEYSETEKKVYDEVTREDFMHADYKYSGFNVRQHSTSQKNDDEREDCVRFDNLRKDGILKDNGLSSFLLHFSQIQGSSSQAIFGGGNDGAGGEKGPSVMHSSASVKHDSGGAGGESSSVGPVPPRSTPPQPEAEDGPEEPFLETVEPVRNSGVKAQCVVIATFNYKGGVKKTSTAINLAATLAKDGSKVFLLDADGQCNTTAFFMKRRALKPHSFDTPNVDDPLVQSQRRIPSDELPHGTKSFPADFFKPKTCIGTKTSYDFNANNINGMLAPILKDNDVQRLKVPQLLSVDPAFYKDKLLLLSGSIELASASVTNTIVEYECRNYGVLRKMFNEIAESYSTPDSPLEFIIIDLGPSIDNIKKAFVMSSDYILPPVNADYFSTSSGRGLLYEVLPDFIKWRKCS
jgi:cellulose biosynthesis protein BcsQ